MYLPEALTPLEEVSNESTFYFLELIMKLKEPTTFEEQVRILESRGVIVKDRDAAVRFLSRVNYYRFSSYLLTFRNPDGETYRTVD